MKKDFDWSYKYKIIENVYMNGEMGGLMDI